MAEPINIDELKKLVEQKKWEEAQQLLEAFFHFNLVETDNDDMLKNTAGYLAAVNSLNRQHLEILENTLYMLKEVEKQKKIDAEAIDLSLARNQIKNS